MNVKMALSTARQGKIDKTRTVVDRPLPFLSPTVLRARAETIKETVNRSAAVEARVGTAQPFNDRLPLTTIKNTATDAAIPQQYI